VAWIVAWRAKIGAELDENEVSDVLMAVKAEAYEKGGELNEDEFREIFHVVKRKAC